MNDSKNIIDKIINEPITAKNYQEAKETLQKCGILDENGEITTAYKDVIFKSTNNTPTSNSQIISPVTIANLISAHIEGNNDKFLSYANFIADIYENANEKRSAEIIRKRISGDYKNDSQISLD